MPKVNWKLIQISSLLDVSSSILSLNYFSGRHNYLDNYPGGVLNVTLNNNTNIADSFVLNDIWELTASTYTGAQRFWVQGVQLDDYPGGTGLSTVTVQLADMLARNGRILRNGVAISQLSTTAQATVVTTTYTPSSGNVYVVAAGSSTASGTTYTGSVGNYLNYLFNTERGVIGFFQESLLLNSRSNVASSTSTYTFSRNDSTATALMYNDITRYKANLNFFNSCTVSSAGLADQTGTNNDSITTYGLNAMTVTTVDYSEPQALGNAQWVANSQSDPLSQTFSVNIFDIPQVKAALQGLLVAFFGFNAAISKVWRLNYRVPGQTSDTTVDVVIEGIGINATPQQTDIQVFMSPLALYQYFTLDSSLLGVLGGGPITYDQATIVYDQTDWIYDDTNVEQGSRLGW
jgi:hypothetical protein